MKRVLIWCTYYLAAVFLLLFLLEIGVRFLSSNIVTQGTDSSILQENKFGNTPGLLPNSQGYVFGKNIVVDENGFIKSE